MTVRARAAPRPRRRGDIRMSEALTFVVVDEDHTLGNAISYCLSRHPDVAFSGYTIPHPAEAKMNIRVQTRAGAERSATECLADGADMLSAISDVLREKLRDAL